MVDAPLKAVFFDFDGVICQTEVCRMDVLEARLHALGLYPDRRKLYRMISGGFRPREAAMDELFGSQPLYWEQREKVLERHPIQFRYPQILTPGITEVTRCSAGPDCSWRLFPTPARRLWIRLCINAESEKISGIFFPVGNDPTANQNRPFTSRL